MTPGGDPHVEMPTTELAEFFDTVRTALVTPIEPDVAAEHLRLMRIAAETAAASAAADRRTVRGGSWRRRWMAVAGLVGGVVGTGGMAVAGALPAPVQDVVAHAVSHVGISLPTHDGTAKSGTHPASPSVTVTTTVTGSAAAGSGSEAGTATTHGSSPSVTVPPAAAVADSVPNPASDHRPDAAPPTAASTHPTHPATPHSSATTAPATTAPATTPSSVTPTTRGNPSDTAPGQSGTAPGQSGTAPGQSPDKTNNAGGNGNANGNGTGNGTGSNNAGGNGNGNGHTT